MSINVDKSNIVVSRNGGCSKANGQWFYRNNPIEVVPFYRYIGTFFTSMLNWNRTQELLALQAKKATSNQSLIFKKHFEYFQHHKAFKLFDSIVSPILTYSAEIWEYECCIRIESVHVKFCKRIACLNSNVYNTLALSERGKHPLSYIYIFKCIKYKVKSLNMTVLSHVTALRCYWT